MNILKSPSAYLAVFAVACTAIPAHADPSTTPTTSTTPSAATAPVDTPPPPIDPAKKALIEQLLQTMHTEEQSDALSKAILDQSPEIVEQIFPADPNATAAQQADAQKEADRIQARFVELFKQQVDIPSIVRSVTFDLYDKYFTADEIKDLIAFYKTPTGQKAVNILPQLSQESMKLTDDALAPKIKALVGQLQDEEAAKTKADTTTTPSK